MMKTALKYTLLTVSFMFLSSGVLVAGLLDVYDRVGYSIFWLLVPMTALFISGVLVNDRLLIPRLLLKGRFGVYCAAVFGVVYTLTLVSLSFEYAVRRLSGLPMRIADYSSPWILVDSLGNGLLLAMILLGLGLLHLFNRWKAELATEELLTAKLKSYIGIVRDRMNPSVIMGKLQAIASMETADVSGIERGIRELSEFLRNQLYELPAPPVIGNDASDTRGYSRIAGLLTAGRFRYWRHIIFLAVLLVISCGAFFNAPDSPEFSVGRMMGMLSMFGLLVVIAYVNILWLYPRFLRRGNIRRYAVAVSVMLLTLVVPLILLQIFTYEPNVYSKRLPWVIACISTVGSVLTLFLFVGGISALLMLRNWIDTGQRLTMLRAETVRQEYIYLRKQINPHFLFNVLNNIGITVYDNPMAARELLGSLKSLLEYQLGEMGRQTTTLSRELSFVRSYFELEATRRDRFNSRIDVGAGYADVTVPTLLFLPLIENAVKYCASAAGVPEVNVRFDVRAGRLIFQCVNTYDMEEIGNLRNGGIGLANTRRRLDLLYQGNYSLVCKSSGELYSVKLEIPLK